MGGGGGSGNAPEMTIHHTWCSKGSSGSSTVILGRYCSLALAHMHPTTQTQARARTHTYTHTDFNGFKKPFCYFRKMAAANVSGVRPRPGTRPEQATLGGGSRVHPRRHTPGRLGTHCIATQAIYSSDPADLFWARFLGTLRGEALLI